MFEALILYPENRQWVPADMTEFTDRLHDCGLLDKNSLQAGNHDFGTAFTSLVTFLGCSPTLYNSDNDSLFTVSILPDIGHTVFIAGNLARPRCRQCRSIISNWENTDSTTTCPTCHAQSATEELAWKRQAALTRFAVIIKGVMEGIAVPSDKLLAILSAESGCNWNYMYYSDSHNWPNFD